MTMRRGRITEGFPRDTVRRARVSLIALLLLGVVGCGGNDSPMEPDPDPDPTPPTYAERIASGWASFTSGAYATASSKFSAAVAADPAPVDAYVGLGWSELKRDDPEAAHGAFETGSTKAGADGLRADLYAGWAFVWNVRTTAPDRHVESNARVVQAETLDPAWVFEHLAGMDRDDLTILAAENFFALGDFEASLARVQSLVPTFDADVDTPEGQAALADEIEALRAG
jgi:hypothetical protein